MYTGGLGSYALLVMVAAFLQSHPSQRPLSARSRMAGALEGSLGVLLLDFFRLYGRALHAEHVGVSCRRVQDEQRFLPHNSKEGHSIAWMAAPVSSSATAF